MKQIRRYTATRVRKELQNGSHMIFQSNTVFACALLQTSAKITKVAKVSTCAQPILSNDENYEKKEVQILSKNKLCANLQDSLSKEEWEIVRTDGKDLYRHYLKLSKIRLTSTCSFIILFYVKRII